MTPGQRNVLLACLPSLLAEETLREKGGSLSAHSLYQTVLQATGDKKEAEKARRRRWLEEMRNGQVPEM